MSKDGGLIMSDGETMEDQPHSEPKPSKRRRRIPLACLSCRKRKSRCNGRKPKCGTCDDLGLICQYVSQGPGQQTVVVGKEHLQSLEDRLATLESALRSQKDGSTPSNQPCTPSANLHTPTSLSHLDTESSFIMQPSSVNAPHEPQVTSDQIAPFRPDTESAETEEALDGLGLSSEALAEDGFAEEENKAFFGSSSSIAFTTELSRILKRLYPRSAFSTSSSSTAIPTLRFPGSSHKTGWNDTLSTTLPSQNAAVSSPEDSLYYLPPEAETTALIDRYFLDTGLMIPYIHEDSFRATYADLKAGKTKGIRKTWLGLLNMVLAMATITMVCKCSEEVTTRDAQAEVFYKRAKALCKGQIISGVSLEIVIYLLLVNQYIHGTSSSIQTWATHGLTVKAALQIGLHSTTTNSKLTPYEREQRNRTWYGVVLLDRMLSMSFGRPASIPESHCRVDMPKYFDLLEPGQLLTDSRKRCRYATDSYSLTILYSIINTMVDQLYDSNLGCEEIQLSPYELSSRVFRIRQSLANWAANLPPQLQLVNLSDLDHITGTGQSPILIRLQTVLTLRYHNARILAHKVVIQRACAQIENVTEANRLDADAITDLARSSIPVLVDSTTEIINIIAKLSRETGVVRRLLPSWWFTLYYIFDAAIVLFATNLLLRLDERLSVPKPHSCQSLQATYQACLESLQCLDDGNKAVHKCYLCLSHLFHFLENDIPVKRLLNQGLAGHPIDNNEMMGYSPDMSLGDPNLPILDLGFLTGENSDSFLYEFHEQPNLG